MQSVQSGKSVISENLSIGILVKGIIFSYIVTVPIFMVFAMLLTFSNFPEKFLSPVVLITTIVSIFAAGTYTTKGLKSRGWLNGSIVGLIYMMVLYILSSLIFANFSVDRYVITMMVIGLLTGAIGGIIGINFKKPSYSKGRARK